MNRLIAPLVAVAALLAFVLPVLSDDSIEAVVAECRAQMIAGTCSPLTSGADTSKPVWISSIGPVPGELYASLSALADGRDLCPTAVAACATAPNSVACWQARQKCPKVRPDMCDEAERLLRADPQRLSLATRVIRAFYVVR